MNSLVLKPSQVKVIPTVEKPDNLGSQEGHLLRSDTKERSRVRVPHKRGCCWVVCCNGPDHSQAPSETLLPENAFPKAAAEGPNYKCTPLSDAVKNPQKADNRRGGGRQSSVWTMHANMHLTCTDDQNQPRSGAAVLSRPLPRPAGRWEFDGQPGCSDGLSAGSTAETLREQPGLSLAPGRVSQSRSSDSGFWKSRRWMLGVGGERPGVAGSKSETATKLSKNRLL